MRKANPAAVGAFVLGAIVLVIGGVLALGSGRFLRETQHYVLFFDGSVNGLTVGSPVKIRGVEIGSVLTVTSLVDTRSRNVVNEVVVEVDSTRFKRLGPPLGTSALVKSGLRARLELQSFVTGQLYVGFDFYPDTPVKLMGFESEYPELPTIPSVSQEVESTVRGLVARLQELPLTEIANNLNESVASLKSLLSSPDLEAAVAQLDDTVTETREMVTDARGLLDDVGAQVDPVAGGAVAALDQARATLATIDGAVQPDSEVRYELARALEEMTEAANAIRRLADYIERNPSSVVFGRASQGEP